MYWIVTRNVDVLGFDLHRLDDDQIAEPLLQRALNEELRGRGQRVAVGRKHELHQAAAEVGPVDPLARRGEQHLLDQVADVLVVVGFRRAAARYRNEMDSRRWLMIRITLVCVENDIQRRAGRRADRLTLDCSNTGMPPAETRASRRSPIAP